MVDWDHPSISLKRQCELLVLSRGSLYYTPAPESEEDLRLKRLIDEEYTRHPFYGVRRTSTWLQEDKLEEVNIKRARRLMREMGLEAIYPKPKLSLPGEGHQIYPYLLKGVLVNLRTKCRRRISPTFGWRRGLFIRWRCWIGSAGM